MEHILAFKSSFRLGDGEFHVVFVANECEPTKWYIVAARGRLTWMVKCKALPTSPHHLKFHNPSKKRKTFFPLTRFVSWHLNPSF